MKLVHKKPFCAVDPVSPRRLSLLGIASVLAILAMLLHFAINFVVFAAHSTQALRQPVFRALDDALLTSASS